MTCLKTTIFVPTAISTVLFASLVLLLAGLLGDLSLSWVARRLLSFVFHIIYFASGWEDPFTTSSIPSMHTCGDKDMSQAKRWFMVNIRSTEELL